MLPQLLFAMINMVLQQAPIQAEDEYGTQEEIERCNQGDAEGTGPIGEGRREGTAPIVKNEEKRTKWQIPVYTSLRI